MSQRRPAARDCRRWQALTTYLHNSGGLGAKVFGQLSKVKGQRLDTPIGRRPRLHSEATEGACALGVRLIGRATATSIGAGENAIDGVLCGRVGNFVTTRAPTGELVRKLTS